MANLYHSNSTLHKGLDPVTAIMNELIKAKMEYETLLDQCAIDKSDIAYLDLLIKELESLDNKVIKYLNNIVNKMIQSIEVRSETEIKVVFINGYIHSDK
ncbi:hypothetical protein [Anaerorhabdus sp.]|uniref:hypothetical protein n=1 Tax=Anaerorhabdus sp. TaxID=1872524 RepID=UPI002FC85498